MKSISINKDLRQGLRLCIAIIAAVLIGHSGIFTHHVVLLSTWIILAVLLVNQTTAGTPLRQGILIYTVMLAAVLSASLLNEKYLALIVSSLCFMLAAYGAYLINLKKLPVNHPLFLVIYFSLILIISLQIMPVNLLLHDIMLALIIGAGIGIISHLCLWPDSTENNFRQSMAIILQGLSKYVHSLIDENSAKKKHILYLLQEGNQIETVLDSRQSAYEIGFNRRLRSGYRFFALQIGRLLEILFAMEYLISKDVIAKMPDDLAEKSFAVLRTNNELLDALSHYFRDQASFAKPSESGDDIAALDQALATVVPNQLALLDISPDYVMYADFARELKDMREVLRGLLNALP